MDWVIKPKAPEEFINQFPEYSPLINQLLWNRGLKTQEAIDEFFSPDFKEDLHDPFLMLGMEKAVKRILQAIEKKEKVVIFGDYDADGVCGAAILYKTFLALGANLLETYIPDRSKEGYGLNLDAIRQLATKDAKLIVSIDCGVTDFEETELANSLNIDVVIIDHHQIIERVPKALAVVDPHQKKDQYPFKYLAAGGVAFKVVQALLLQLAEKGKPALDNKVEIPAGWEKWLLDLVAIATVADCVSLLGENRTLVKYGLVVLAQTNKVGLRELMKNAGLSPTVDLANLETNLGGHTLGFMLGPRLNAASRMSHATSAFNLLITESDSQAKELAGDLERQNAGRQALMEKIMNEIQGRLEKNKEISSPIFEGSREWPIGLLGLIAGRLSDKYNMPAIIFNIGEKFCKASARSIPKFNLVETMKKMKNLFLEFGGHPQAAAFSFKESSGKKIEESFRSQFKERLKGQDLSPEIEVDGELKTPDINFSLYDQIYKFAPFGKDNPKPIFLIKEIEILNIKNVGNNGKHLKLELKSEALPDKIFKAIGFNHTSKNGHLKIGDKVDLIFELMVDQWNGTRELQLKIIDIKAAA